MWRYLVPDDAFLDTPFTTSDLLRGTVLVKRQGSKHLLSAHNEDVERDRLSC
jgi:hypothetical protein